MNLFNLGLTGVRTSELRLQVAANNMQNVLTPGYNRQSVQVATNSAMSTGTGYIGMGVNAVTIQRAYDGFLYQQLSGAESKESSLRTQSSQLTQIASLFSDRTVGVSPAISAFFSSLNSLASSPADPAIREDVIGKGNTLVSQIKSAYNELQTQRDGLNTQISNAVTQVNSYLNEINDLNKSITTATGTGHAPNDLLDLRDQKLRELNSLVGIKTVPDGDRVTVTLENGTTLLSGNKVYPLVAKPSDADPQRVVVAATIQTGPTTSQTVDMADSSIVNGTLGGLVSVRANSLDGAQNRLGQLSIALATAFNAIHSTGKTAAGAGGGDFFSIGNPKILKNAGNTGAAALKPAYKLDDIAKLNTSDYQIRFDATAGEYMVTRLPNGTAISAGTGPLNLDGVSIEVEGDAADGDTWILSPTRDAARDLTQLVQNSEDIAAADAAGGSANGATAKALAALQSDRIFNSGTANLTELYSQFVNVIGVDAAGVKSAFEAQTKLANERFAAQQNVSGTSETLEMNDMMTFQRQYQASAKVLQTASTIFDTILGLKG
ncbi:flagellar hook-associated protein FlgK [Schauerella aestuarii]|uniref:flagellar hook-associated protein FlgK n=1 Tax=Schauerella aestuarii TaxID=2511204 RepID=UPI0013687E0D|nr:flagellar hook-associated protein FlgK [Achromobacter aestuarii]MYZ44889.1 flagellar hook-associated protein FlgK [Achromobacter aestuarii]